MMHYRLQKHHGLERMPDLSLEALARIALDQERMGEVVAEMQTTQQAILQALEVVVSNQDGHTELLKEIVSAATMKKPKSDLPAALERLAQVLEVNTKSTTEMLEAMIAVPATMERVVTVAVEKGVANVLNDGVVD